jgi:hypothetical protein
MATDAARGSQKLLSELIKKGTAATPEEVKAAVAIPAAAEIKLLRWLIRGIPPIYYEVETVVELPVAQAAGLLGALLHNPTLRDVYLNTRGVPVYDRAQVTTVVAHQGPITLPTEGGGQRQ